MINKVKSFKDLIAWQKSMELVVEIYKITDKFPQSEIYNLGSQMRRAAVAMPSNIAEGFSREHTKEYAQFISIAFASGAELETQLEISKRLNLIGNDDYIRITSILNEVMKMLNKLGQVLKSKHS